MDWSLTPVTPAGHPFWSPLLVTPSGHPCWSPKLVIHSGHPCWSPTLVTPTFVRPMQDSHAGSSPLLHTIVTTFMSSIMSTRLYGRLGAVAGRIHCKQLLGELYLQCPTYNGHNNKVNMRIKVILLLLNIALYSILLNNSYLIKLFILNLQYRKNMFV